MDVFIQNLPADGAADQVKTLPQGFCRWDCIADAEGVPVKIRVIIHFVYGIKRGFAHALHSNICQHDITILDLKLCMVTANFHAVAAFDKITFAKDCTDNCKSPAWDDAFICKFNSNIFSHGSLRNLISLLLPVYYKWHRMDEELKVVTEFCGV